jgi:hypothetical protein
MDATTQTAQTDALLAWPEPSIRYKVPVGVLGESESSRSIRSLRREIRKSARVGALLAGRVSDGRLLHWQWPDGGWNCDNDPNGGKSQTAQPRDSARFRTALNSEHR